MLQETKTTAGKLISAGAPFTRLAVSLCANDIRIKALIDMGAARTLLGEDVFLKIANSFQRSRLVRKNTNLVTVSGDVLPTIGSTEIKMNGFPPIDVIVVKDISHELILGDDVLRRGSAKINYDALKMRLFDIYYKLINNDSEGIHEIKQTTGHKEIDKVLSEYSDIFCSKGQPIGQCNVGKCTIDTGEHAPIKQRPYRMPLSKRHLVENQVQEMLDAGIIRPSASPWATGNLSP